MPDDSAKQSDTPGQRAASYWFTDGLPFIVSGLLFAIWGALGICSILSLTPKWGHLLPGAFGAFVVFFCAVAPGLDRSFTEALKARITYPRTGYAPRPMDDAERRFTPGFARSLEPLGEPFQTSLKLRERPVPDENMTFFRYRTLLTLFGVAVAATMTREFGYFDRPWVLPLVMSAMAAALIALNSGYDPPYSWRSLLLLPAIALLTLPFDLPAGIRIQLVPLIPGLWLVTLGAWRLISYLREYPKRQRAYGVRV